jgi:vacuolar-type H+-ATPase subunit I/STV1
MKRRNTGPSVSFFAFQDIITAVVGIFILITLLLVLELAQRVEAAASTPTADISSVKEMIETLQGEVDRMTEEIQERIESQNETAGINEFNRQEETEKLEDKSKVLQQQIASANEMAIDLSKRIAAAKQEENKLLLKSQELGSQRALLEELEKRLAQVQNEINRLESDDTPVFRDQTEQGRFITLITLAAGKIEVRDALTKSKQDYTGPRRTNDLFAWLDANDLSSRQVYLVIKPGGTTDFHAVQEHLDDSNAVYGFNVTGAADSIRLGFEMPPLP